MSGKPSTPAGMKCESALDETSELCDISLRTRHCSATLQGNATATAASSDQIRSDFEADAHSNQSREVSCR
ncbi:hypothetical protein BLNAU_5450 [Blattamonas nauphoetae]|uniref:Uncharacterized protein n=1 Tax=Blattamonas nauphoetae TaxID=2049346 RepID=A0ABQ9Y7H5_9EUKA|nr:hypothetical protein BLNAU_5450 [Blattamonas nauphoetae]